MIRIAEAKKKSPWEGIISYLPMEELLKKAIELGDWISVHTEEPWGGSIETLKMARAMTNKPIMAKGFHRTNESVEAAFKAGADYVLVVGRMAPFEGVIVEPASLEDVKTFNHARMMMWNRRDLSNGHARKFSWDLAKKLRKGWLGCASLGPPFPVDADACLFSVR